MDLSAAINRVLVPGREANPLRWKGERGIYEVYYLTLNHLPSRLGFWLRYTLDARDDGGGSCELWGHVFDGSAPERSFGLKERWPLSRLGRPQGAILSIGDAALTPTSARGALGAGERALSWDLGFLPAERAVFMAPYPLRALGLTSTHLVIAQPDARFRGRMAIGDRELFLDAAPGTLAHLWGRKHAERWVWAHCNAFDGRDDCALDAVAVWVRRLGRLRGPLTSVFLRYRGRDYCLNALPTLLAVRSRAQFPEWSFTAHSEGLRFVGTFRSSPPRMLQVSYEDPDGDKLRCANTEIADLTLEIWKGRQCQDVLVAEGTAHLEFGGRASIPGVRATV
jgi:hypothetical protein